MTLELRIPPPVVLLVSGALAWALARLTPAFAARFPGRMAIAGAIVVLGIGVAVAGVVAFNRARTTVNPLKPEESSALVVSGIYARTRNPMYVGMALVLLGWGIFLAHPAALLGLVAFVLYIDRFQIRPEERALRRLFGEAFEGYCGRVRRWL